MHLPDLRALWSATRSVHAARALAACLRNTHGSLPTGRSQAATEAWDRLAETRDEGALPALLEALPSGTAGEAAVRLAALEGWDDPRIELALVGWLGSLPFRTRPNCEAFWRPVFERMQVRGPVDVRWDDIADAVHATGTGFAIAHAARVRRLGQTLRPARRALEPAERQALAELGFSETAREVEPERDTDALLGAIAANPEDLALRAVFADVLQEIGDPRGEFVALQLDEPGHRMQTFRIGEFFYVWFPGGKGRHAARLEELARAHVDGWLGPWVSVVCRVDWENGLPVRAEPYSKWPKVGKLVDQPALRTVRELVIPNVDRRGGLRKVLASEVTANVRTLRGAYLDDLPVARARHASTLTTLGMAPGATHDLRPLVAELASWTALQTLVIEMPALDEPPIGLEDLRVPTLQVEPNRSPPDPEATLAALAGAVGPGVRTVRLVTPDGAVSIDR
ncbi:MAG: TIGR02996 domain-containing protein [Myxococcota bacterium]